MTFNGWTNRETWLVNLHFNPQSKEDVEFAQFAIEEMEEKLAKEPNLFLHDYIDFSLINWNEIFNSVEGE